MKCIMSQEYLELIEERVSDKYYKNISGELEFLSRYVGDDNFSVVLVGSTSVVVPSSGVIFV